MAFGAVGANEYDSILCLQFLVDVMAEPFHAALQWREIARDQNDGWFVFHEESVGAGCRSNEMTTEDWDKPSQNSSSSLDARTN